MKQIKSRMWILLMFVMIAAGMAAFMAANYVIDPVDYFAATSSKETYNPNNFTRKIKTEYILKRFPDVEGIFLGGSKAGVLSAKRMSHYTGLSYYNLSFTHGNFSDYETWTRFLLKKLKNLKEITIHLSSIETGYFSWHRDVYPDSKTRVPALVEENPWEIFTENLSYLCTDLRTTIDGLRNPDSGITRDTLATGQKNWRRAIRSFSEDPEKYLEKNFYSGSHRFLSNLFKRTASDSEEYYQENLDALIRIRDMCAEKGVTLKIMVGASHIYERYQYECEEYLVYLKQMVMITGGLWDFSSYSDLNLNPCNFYEKRHYTDQLGDLEIDIMNGAKDGEDYDGFGIYLTPENVDDYLNQRRSDWSELKAEFEETGDVAIPGMDDESYIRESDPVI